jgi:hypothetical protein
VFEDREEEGMMRVRYGLLFVVLLAFLPQLQPTLAAQDMDTLDRVFREEYEQLLLQENVLLQRIENLKDLKSRIDDMIEEASAAPTTDYAQETDRYQRLELLLPPAVKYSQELEQTLKKLEAVQQKKEDLRAKVLERQSDLPIWWTQ